MIARPALVAPFSFMYQYFSFARLADAAAVVLCIFTMTAATHAADPGTIELVTLDGEKVFPLKCSIEAKEKATVAIFVTTDCPIANSFAPEINRLHLAYASRNVRLTLIHVDSKLSDDDAGQHAADYELKPPVAIDREHALVKAVDARVTPEAFVYDAGGKLRYRGRINNLYAALGKRRATVTVHDLRDAIEAVINDREVVTPETEALGCFIETE